MNRVSWANYIFLVQISYQKLWNWSAVDKVIAIIKGVPFYSPQCTINSFAWCGQLNCFCIQEAQLPHRNSASAAHTEGAKPSSPLPLPPLATPMRTVESETRNKRTSSVLSVKRTLSWIGHSRSFNVILICADRNPEWYIVVMSN